jgi:hypothetical protein
MTEDEEDPVEIIRKNLRRPAGYKLVSELFTKTIEKRELGAVYSEPIWRLYIARPEFKAIDDIVFDEQGFVNPKRPGDFSVGDANEEDINKIVHETPPKYRKELERILFSRIDKPEGYDGKPQTLEFWLYKSNAVRKAISRIADPHCITRIDWVEFIDSLIAWKCKKDERIKPFLKKDLLRGLEPRLNPVSICGKPPQTGMGEFYMRHCLHLGTKVTKKSFLGFALSPEDVYPGVIDGQDLTVCVEQIESSDYPDIFGHLYAITIQGEDYVSSGAVRFPVKSLSPFTFLFNIQQKQSSEGNEEHIPEKDFLYNINQIASNTPAFLQRVSNILYEPELKKAVPETNDLEEWVERGRFFRGIEELAMPNLRKWFKDDKIWKWATEPIDKYFSRIKDIATSLENKSLQYALTEHGKPPHPKLKGSALRVVFVEILDEVLLSNTLDIQKDIISPSEEYLAEFVEQNIASLSKIAETWDEQKELGQRNVFDKVFPLYIQLLVGTIIMGKKRCKYAPGDIVPIEEFDEFYSGCKLYPRLSSVTTQFKSGRGKKALERYNHYFRTYFGFEILKKEGDLLFVSFQ